MGNAPLLFRHGIAMLTVDRMDETVTPKLFICLLLVSAFELFENSWRYLTSAIVFFETDADHFAFVKVKLLDRHRRAQTIWRSDVRQRSEYRNICRRQPENERHRKNAKRQP